MTKENLGIWISAFVCGIAGAFAESANAQDSGVMVSAKAPVFAESSATFPAMIAADPIDISESLSDIREDVQGNSGFQAGLRNVLIRRASGGKTRATLSGIDGSGNPQFGGEAVAAGDVLELRDVTIQPTAAALITVRVYRKAAGGDFFVAIGDFPTPQTERTDGERMADEFFLDSDFVSATALEAGVFGITPVQCANGYISDDEVSCRLPNDGDECGMFYDGDRPIHDTTAEGNCRATAAADCTGDTAFFEGGVCVSECSDGMQAGDDGKTCEAAPEEPTDPTPPPPGDGEEPTNPTPTIAVLDGGGDDETKDLRNILGGVGVVMFFATWAFSDDLNDYEFSPSFGYSVNENGYSANAGGRLDFRKDDWSAYWSAGQANANGEFGEFRYSSGGEYKADFWQASFSESVQGKTADYDLSLSADLQGGMWSLSPVYRMHSRFDDGESVSRNSLNLEGILRYENWQIRQSAGFGWRRADEFGDNARFRLDAVRDF